MPPAILSPRSQATLQSFVRAGSLMAFDFDGVLAPIVAARERAHLRGRTRELLTRLAQRFPCIVVSGRQLSDLAPRLEGIPLRMVFGNFGHEPPMEGIEPPPIVAEWVEQLQQRLRAEPGVVVEDKRFSVAVHYRQSPHPVHARHLVERVLGEMRGGRVLEGLMAVMLVPRSGPTKGSTLQAVRRRLGCDRAVYLGDDETDESAFASGPPERLLSIRVGKPRPTGASFRLDRQTDVDRLLARILAMSKP